VHLFDTPAEGYSAVPKLRLDERRRERVKRVAVALSTEHLGDTLEIAGFAEVDGRRGLHVEELEVDAAADAFGLSSELVEVDCDACFEAGCEENCAFEEE